MEKDLVEGVKNFVNAIGIANKEVNRLIKKNETTHSYVNELGDRIQQVVSQTETLKDTILKKTNTFNYVSVFEFTEKARDLPIGSFHVSIKELDVFTVYKGDTHCVLVYPDFVDIGKPFKECGFLRMSKFIFETNKWQN